MNPKLQNLEVKQTSKVYKKKLVLLLVNNNKRYVETLLLKYMLINERNYSFALKLTGSNSCKA